MKFTGIITFSSICMVLTLLFIGIIAGCTSTATTSKDNLSTVQSVTETPISPLQSAADVPVTTIVPSKTTIPQLTTTLSNGWIISYPANWEKQEVSETSLREYGRTTTNIVNFFSPSFTNVDLQNTYTTFSIDVDPEYVSQDDCDRYFNLATVAIQKQLGTIEITRHQQTGPGYKGPSECADCIAIYNLEFNSKEGSRWYQFLNIDGKFYIITMKNPIDSHSELIEMLSSIKVPPSIMTKHR